MTRPFLKRNHVLSLPLLFGVAFVARLSAIGRYVTPDELNWVYRSIQLREALLAGDWANTLITGHPGVTTTWLGALGIQLQLWLHPADRVAYEWLTHMALLTPDNVAAFERLAVFLTAGRLGVAVVTSLGVVGMFWVIRPFLGNLPALLTALL
ncbi:MAG: hypothetical protein D6706_20405, partial [Chloroflexi bacterium]